MQARDRLLIKLSDGHFHSGQKLAESAGVSRSAVWKQVRRLQADFGLRIDAVRGRGYRLAGPLELLDLDRIRPHLGDDALACLEGIHLISSTSSTNSCAQQDLPAEPGMARVWLAEHQSDGRGRRGRQWVSTFGENLYLSLAWRFDLPMSELAGLSLVTGVVVAEVLAELGLRGHQLKWPNDVQFDGRKLAGVLVEASGEADGPSTAVIGIGVNMRLSDNHGAAIGQPWTDLARISEGQVSRNQLAGMLIDRLIRSCRLYATHQMRPFVDRWKSFDRLIGQPVKVISGKRVIHGVYRGIASTGALLLEDRDGLRECHAGEVSLRKEVDA